MFIVYDDGRHAFVTTSELEKDFLQGLKKWKFDANNFDRKEVKENSVLISSRIFVD